MEERKKGKKEEKKRRERKEKLERNEREGREQCRISILKGGGGASLLCNG